ncbi:Factor of DNA methylation 1 [Bienertia sinuspersici]
MEVVTFGAFGNWKSDLLGYLAEITMADKAQRELINLRRIVVRLANEIDYKNHLLFEKEGLSLEKFATMSSLIEEKDRLLGERSAVIGSLMAQKHRLHEDFVEVATLRAENEDLKAQLENLRKELYEKEALHQSKSLNQTLISNECSSSEELKDARMEVIKCFVTMDDNGTKIGIKRIGEIDSQPFRDVCSKKLCSRNWEAKSDELYSLWQDNVKDPSWNPFKKEIQSGQLSMQEIVDEYDKKLVELREEWGEEPFKAVVNALLDIKKYNPSLRSSISELWNFEEGRRAYLKEVIQYMIRQWEVYKSKDIEQSGAITKLMEEKQKLLQKLASVNILMEEKDKVLKEKYAEVSKLIIQDMEKNKVIGQMSATISTLMAEKHIILESCNAEKRTIQCMKEQTEKLKHALDSPELSTEQTTESKDKRQYSYVEDKTDNYQDLTEQAGPIAGKLKSSQFHNINEQISSTSEIIKFQGQSTGEILKLPKAEPGMPEKLSDGKQDLVGVSQPATHPNPSRALVSSPSQYSVLLERFFSDS